MEDIKTLNYFCNQQKAKSPQNADYLQLLNLDFQYKIIHSTSTNATMATSIKTINIFIASQSILKEQRDFIDDLIRKKNDEFHAKGFYLKPIRWEDEDKGIDATRTQDLYNQKLLESHVMILLMWNSIGKFTKEEFTIAYDNLKMHNKPYKIYAFNCTKERTPSEDEIRNGSITSFYDLKKTLWVEEKHIIPFTENDTLRIELEKMFIFIEKSL